MGRLLARDSLFLYLHAYFITMWTNPFTLFMETALLFHHFYTTFRTSHVGNLLYGIKVIMAIPRRINKSLDLAVSIKKRLIYPE
jgi:hypothetical protein